MKQQRNDSETVFCIAILYCTTEQEKTTKQQNNKTSKTIMSTSSNQPQQPILFLDVDGVLCLAGPGLYQLPHQRSLHSPSVSLLKQLIEETDCLVVVSSSWRKKKNSLLLLKEKLEKEGELREGCVGEERVTPVVGRGKRDEEIVGWLRGCGEEMEGRRWAVLDDSEGKFGGEEGKEVKRHLVVVRSSVGFSEGDYVRTKKLLLGERK